VTVAMATVLFDGLLLGTLLGDVSLFVAVVIKVIAASASKKGVFNWTPTSGSQWHLVFHGCGHQGVGNVGITYLFQCLHLLHPSLHSIHLHVDCEQGT